MPTYNGEKYLALTLESILAQDDNNIECIVVDDGSTDHTLSILGAYHNRLPIRLEKRKQGNWVSNTNHALSLATGEYACFLHQDDLWFNSRLELMKTLIEKFPDVGLFLHPSIFIDQNGNHVGVWQCPLPANPQVIEPSGMMEKLLVQNFISIPAPIFKRKIALASGGLDNSLWYTADWDLWLKISSVAKTVYHPQPLSGFRIHPHSQTMMRSAYLKEFRRQLEIVFRKYFDIWDADRKTKERVFKVASFSIEVNTTLAGAMHHTKTGLLRLAASFLLLGPSGWHNYLKNSRIWERTAPRLKVLLKIRFSKIKHVRSVQSD